MLYLDVRVRKEALDLEWSAHATAPVEANAAALRGGDTIGMATPDASHSWSLDDAAGTTEPELASGVQLPPSDLPPIDTPPSFLPVAAPRASAPEAGAYIPFEPPVAEPPPAAGGQTVCALCGATVAAGATACARCGAPPQ